MQITNNFTLEELTYSSTANINKINNQPDKQAEANLIRLAKDILQPIRDKYGLPITVNSGYRCSTLNKLVGGSKTSQHLTGQAADIRATKTTNSKLFNLIKDMIQSGEITVGQLIWEYGSKTEPNWIHVSLPYSKKNQILYYYSK